MIAMCIYANFYGEPIGDLGFLMAWSLQIGVYILFLIVLHQSIYTVKKYLFENIEELEKSITEINKLAYFDNLTGLPNDYKFQILVKERLRLTSHNGYIMIINLKSMRLINSMLGYQAGNQTLIDIAEVFARVKKENEIVSRIGGNEFGIWLENVTEEEFIERSRLILMELEKHGKVMQKKLEFYSAYSFLRFGYKTFEDCYREVALTLAHAKSGNIHELTAYCDAIEDDLRRKEKIKDLIASAISSGEITLYYQAKCDSRTGEVVGVEALARWKSPELGMVSPGEFIPIIELVNMSKEFGDFVIKRACGDFEKLQKKYSQNIKVSVNISPTHIKDPLIVKTVQNALEKYKIPDNRMVVEITEDLLIEGIETVRDVLMNLKALNVQISLDDFGTGYSSLNYLGQFDFDEIKIDKTFVDQIDSTERANILLDNIIQLSKKFDLSIVAEGVETKEQSERLDELGCYIIQGYYYHKPEKI
jgi:diguanylate cyclase (GGDEF)-like protein